MENISQKEYDVIVRAAMDSNFKREISLPNMAKIYDIFKIFTHINGDKPFSSTKDIALVQKIESYFENNLNRLNDIDVQKQQIADITLSDFDKKMADRLFQAYQHKTNKDSVIKPADIYFCVLGKRALQKLDEANKIIATAFPLTEKSNAKIT